jgi:hypothetical protein
MQKLLMPADGIDPAALDGPGDETALDTGGEFFGDGDGSGKAFWPGKELIQKHSQPAVFEKCDLKILFQKAINN